MGVSSGKSIPLSLVALKVSEQVRLRKEGGGELPQQFPAKPGEAVKEGERVRQEGVTLHELCVNWDDTLKATADAGHLEKEVTVTVSFMLESEYC
ncbi:hypothetical protein PAMA_018797 [Pampus argenteus]